MNRFQHTGTYAKDHPLEPSAAERERVLGQRTGINVEMSPKRRSQKQARHRANAQKRLAESTGFGLSSQAYMSKC